MKLAGQFINASYQRRKVLLIVKEKRGKRNEQLSAPSYIRFQLMNSGLLVIGFHASQLISFPLSFLSHLLIKEVN